MSGGELVGQPVQIAPAERPAAPVQQHHRAPPRLQVQRAADADDARAEDGDVTRSLVDAGKLLRINVLDHVITGHPQHDKPHVSLRELGYFYS